MSGSDGASDAVLYEATDSGVAILTFNRPDRLNAWGPDIAAGFYAAIDRAEHDPAIRAIVLTGGAEDFAPAPISARRDRRTRSASRWRMRAMPIWPTWSANGRPIS